MKYHSFKQNNSTCWQSNKWNWQADMESGWVNVVSRTTNEVSWQNIITSWHKGKSIRQNSTYLNKFILGEDIIKSTFHKLTWPVYKN